MCKDRENYIMSTYLVTDKLIKASEKVIKKNKELINNNKENESGNLKEKNKE